MAESTAQALPDRKRSPGFPTIDLQEAIRRVKLVHEQDGTNPTSQEVVAGHWDNKVTSSTFLQAIASVKRFGLLVEAGSKRVKVSPSALDILLLPVDDPKRVQRIKDAALLPKLHKELWTEFGVSLPSDATLRHNLVSTRGFQVAPANELIAQYRSTLAFAKLTNDDKISDNGQEKPIKIGDLIQWRSQGFDQFPEPRKVAGKSDDDLFLFVEGEQCGIPVEQAIVMSSGPLQASNHTFGGASSSGHSSSASSSASKVAAPLNPNYKPSATTVKQDAFTSETGEIIVRWPAVLASADKSDLAVWLDRIKRRILESIQSDTTEPAEPRKPRYDAPG